jgi:hypothetical protein
MTKKILYSPSFGAGWSSWNATTAEQYKYLCEYQPLIDFLEQHDGTMPPPLSQKDWYGDSYLQYPVIKTLADEWKARYGSDLYLNGLRKLKIKEIAASDRYHIAEYDGKESVKLYSEVEDDIWIS